MHLVAFQQSQDFPPAPRTGHGSSISSPRFQNGSRAGSPRRLQNRGTPISRIAAVVLVAALTAFAAPIRADVETPLCVQLRWLHQAQFAGYYLAEARTYHGRAAMEIDLVEGGPGIDPLDRLEPNPSQHAKDQSRRVLIRHTS